MPDVAVEMMRRPGRQLPDFIGNRRRLRGAGRRADHPNERRQGARGSRFHFEDLIRTRLQSRISVPLCIETQDLHFASDPLRARRLVRPRAKRQFLGTKLDDISVGKRRLRRHLFTPNERAIRALQVIQNHAFHFVGNADPGMPPRNTGVIEPHVATRIAADDVVACFKDKGAVSPHEPATCFWFLMTAATAAKVGRLAAKCITNTVRGSDELRRLSILRDRPSNFADEHVQIAVDDEGVGPDLAEQIGLWNYVRTPGDERTQQIERLW